MNRSICTTHARPICWAKHFIPHTTNQCIHHSVAPLCLWLSVFVASVHFVSDDVNSLQCNADQHCSDELMLLGDSSWSKTSSFLPHQLVKSLSTSLITNSRLVTRHRYDLLWAIADIVNSLVVFSIRSWSYVASSLLILFVICRNRKRLRICRDGKFIWWQLFHFSINIMACAGSPR